MFGEWVHICVCCVCVCMLCGYVVCVCVCCVCCVCVCMLCVCVHASMHIAFLKDPRELMVILWTSGGEQAGKPPNVSAETSPCSFFGERVGDSAGQGRKGGGDQEQSPGWGGACIQAWVCLLSLPLCWSQCEAEGIIAGFHH